MGVDVVAYQKKNKEYEEVYSFRVGSYSSLTRWTNIFETFISDKDSEDILYYFSIDENQDSEMISQLYNFFSAHLEEAEKYSKKIDDVWWLYIYQKFVKAFEYALNDGLIVFC